MFKLICVALAGCTYVTSAITTELTLVESVFGAQLSANPTHYGDPNTGCKLDEIPIKVQGVRGGMCTAHCSVSGGCPTDKPDACDAVPRCALENRSTGEKFCALMCQAGMQCGQGASCKIVQGNLGICTYDDVAASTVALRGIDHA